MKKSSAYYQRGVSLAELVIVVIILGFLSLLITNIPSSISSINKSKHTSIAKTIASRKMESLRRITYANLVDGNNSFTDTDLYSLPSATATVGISDCPANICTNQEHAKQAQVTIGWKEGSDAKQVKFTTIIGEGGL